MYQHRLGDLQMMVFPPFTRTSCLAERADFCYAAIVEDTIRGHLDLSPKCTCPISICHLASIM